MTSQPAFFLDSDLSPTTRDIVKNALYDQCNIYLQCAAAAHYILLKHDQDDKANSVAAAAKELGGTSRWIYCRPDIADYVRRILEDAPYSNTPLFNITFATRVTLQDYGRHPEDWKWTVSALLDHAELAEEGYRAMRRIEQSTMPPPARHATAGGSED